MRGLAAEVYNSYWVADGPWTWSKLKDCFLGADGDAAAEGAPGAVVVASTETDVDEEA